MCRVYLAWSSAILLLSAGCVWQGDDAVSRELHRAVVAGDAPAAAKLLAEGADVNVIGLDGWAPLHWSAYKGRADLLRLLVDNGADVNIESEKGNAALYLAVQEQHENIVRLLVAEGADVNAREKRGWTPLHLAARRGDTAIAGRLISGGARVNVRTEEGVTPLGIAARECHTGMVELLAAHGADVKAKDSAGWFPLALSAAKGHTRTAKLLLSRGADVHAELSDGSTPLCLAAIRGDVAMARLLIKNHAEVNHKRRDARTPLHLAAEQNHRDIVKVLLANGADASPVGKDGWTPLHAAAGLGHKEMVEILIEGGAKVGARDRQGMTPLDMALVGSGEEDQITELLQRHGGKRCKILSKADIDAYRKKWKKATARDDGHVPLPTPPKWQGSTTPVARQLRADDTRPSAPLMIRHSEPIEFAVGDEVVILMNVINMTGNPVLLRTNNGVADFINVRYDEVTPTGTKPAGGELIPIANQMLAEFVLLKANPAAPKGFRSGSRYVFRVKLGRFERPMRMRVAIEKPLSYYEWGKTEEHACDVRYELEIRIAQPASKAPSSAVAP